jgi:hypothetical protein
MTTYQVGIVSPNGRDRTTKVVLDGYGATLNVDSTIGEKAILKLRVCDSTNKPDGVSLILPLDLRGPLSFEWNTEYRSHRATVHPTYTPEGELGGFCLVVKPHQAIGTVTFLVYVEVEQPVTMVGARKLLREFVASGCTFLDPNQTASCVKSLDAEPKPKPHRLPNFGRVRIKRLLEDL